MSALVDGFKDAVLGVAAFYYVFYVAGHLHLISCERDHGGGW